MAIFNAEVNVTIGKEVQAKTSFTEFEIPDEIIREYRSFVETGFAAVLAKAAIVILSEMDPKALMDAAPALSSRILEKV